VIAYLVDGDDGSIDQEIQIDDFSGFQLGAYGGAVDTVGNLYFTPMGAVTFGGQLARVDIQTFDVTLWPLPEGLAPYGITVDHTGKVWVSGTLGAGAGRFDPATETWDLVQAPFISVGGLAEAQDGHIWVATENGAASVDAVTLALGPTFTTNTGGTVKGISVDRHGYVWAVNQIAYKVDPATGVAVGTYNGLSSPYTYSDMTGWALSNVTCPPAG
jgi:streptogramin lyase